jgi:hypothetical protein
MKQRKLKFPRLIILGTLFLGTQWIWSEAALAKPEKTVRNSRVIMILVDMSDSTNEARPTVYKEAFEKIYQDLGQGDRLVVGTINSRSYIDFKPTVDEEIPKKSIWDNRLEFERSLAHSKAKIRSAVKKLLSRERGSGLTEILESLNIADTIFHDEKERQKILVILSDMIQDSKDYKFDKDQLTDEYINNVIAHREKNSLIPNLTGVKIYVAGASATDSDKFRAVQTFWDRYLTKSGADFSPHRYGHSLISFENGS